jgi:hypothetical protein
MTFSFNGRVCATSAVAVAVWSFWIDCAAAFVVAVAPSVVTATVWLPVKFVPAIAVAED